MGIRKALRHAIHLSKVRIRIALKEARYKISEYRKTGYTGLLNDAIKWLVIAARDAERLEALEEWYEWIKSR